MGAVLFLVGCLVGFFLYPLSLFWSRDILEAENSPEDAPPQTRPPAALVQETLKSGFRSSAGTGIQPLPRIATAFFAGSLFLLAYQYAPTFPDLLKLLVVFTLLLIVTLIDLHSHIIPNSLVLAVLIWGVFWQFINPPLSWPAAFLGLLLGGGFLLVAAVISRGGMGGGDVKLMFAAGFYLGPILTAQALFIAVFTGAIVGIFLLLFRIKKRKDPIPFGPFLCLGIASALLFGPLL